MNGRLYYDRANARLDDWNAELMGPSFEQHVFSDVSSLLLRGSTLRNTEMALGISINLGNKTKIMMNQRKARVKVSAVMKKMGSILYSVFAFQLLNVIACATLGTVWNSSDDKAYLGEADEANVGRWIINFLTYWVTFAHMVPISVFIITDVLKFAQGLLVSRDVLMYSSETGKAALCNNSNVVEELGQVGCLFCDKTGTLTRNEMEFKLCSVNNVVYGDMRIPGGMDADSQGRILQLLEVDAEDHRDKDAMRNFVMALSVCHQVECEDDGE